MFRCPNAGILILVLGAAALCGGEAPPKAPAEPEAAYPLVRDLAGLQGAVWATGGGRVELFYDWSDAAQLADWLPLAGGPARLAEGELRLGGDESHALRHVAAFAGPVEIAGSWRVDEELDPRGHVGVGLCAAPWRGYWLLLGDGQQSLYRESGLPAFLATGDGRIPNGSPHRFHFARPGAKLRVWLDGERALHSPDPAFDGGAVVLRTWRARAGLRSVWIAGHLAPQWLAANPSVARQLDAMRLYAAGFDALRPLWREKRYADAVAAAKSPPGQQAGASAPGVVKWLTEDAEALAGLPFAQQVAKPETPRDHLAVALLRLIAAPPDLAGARAELALAKAGGIDVSRHRGLTMARPETAGPVAVAVQGGGGRLTFAGKPLAIEAEQASLVVPPMQVDRDEEASGGRFVWEPLAPGQDQYGEPAARVVFHVVAAEESTAYLWVRVRTPSSNANSFRFGVIAGEAESGKLRDWHLAPRPGWHWEPYDAGAVVDKGGQRASPIQLQAGVNSIIIGSRERGAALDSLILSPTPDPPAETLK